MADELLSSIIRLESEIQDQLQTEQARAEAWLEQVRDEEHERLLEVTRRQEEEDARALEEAKKQAHIDSEKIENRENKRCHCLESMDDSELLEVLKRHLLKVLPGQSR